MYEVTEDHASRRIRQLSVYLPQQLGALLGVTRLLESLDVRLCAISILDAADHAIVRLVVDQPQLAYDSLVREDFWVLETEILGVVLPHGESHGVRRVLQTLLLAELNVSYAYALISRPDQEDVLALHAEDLSAASRTLVEQGFELVGQEELD